MTENSGSAPGFVVGATRELDAPPAVAWRSSTDPAIAHTIRIHEVGYATAEPLEMSRQGLEQSLDKLTPLFVGGKASD